MASGALSEHLEYFVADGHSDAVRRGRSVEPEVTPEAVLFPRRRHRRLDGEKHGRCEQQRRLSHSLNKEGRLDFLSVSRPRGNAGAEESVNENSRVTHSRSLSLSQPEETRALISVQSALPCCTVEVGDWSCLSQ